ncbi:hypothetical protein [Legionella sp.]|uniref:hypothetical protein n=1 Tax=Legionella sp. TaxID=459 RepID=UPI003D09C3D6
MLLLDKLSIQRSIIINFYESTLSEYPLHVKIYRFGNPIPLSDILPMLENDDGFNKLVLGAGLSWRELNIIRAYAKYMHQAGIRKWELPRVEPGNQLNDIFVS